MALSLAVGLSLHALAMMPSHLPTLPSSRPSYGLVGADGRSARAASAEREDGEHVAHPYTASQSRVDHLTRVHLVQNYDSGGSGAHMLGEPTGASQDRDAEMEHGPVEVPAVPSEHARSLGKAAHRTRPVVMITEDERKQVEKLKQLVAEYMRQVEQIKAAGQTPVKLTEDERKQVVEQMKRIMQAVEQMKQGDEREQVLAEQLVEVTNNYGRLLSGFYLLSGALCLGPLPIYCPGANLGAEAYFILLAYMLIAPRVFDVSPRPAALLGRVGRVIYALEIPFALLLIGSSILSAADKIAAQP